MTSEHAAPLDRILLLGASPWRRWLSLPIASAAWASAAMALLVVSRSSDASTLPDTTASLTMVQVEPPPPPLEPEIAPIEPAPVIVGAPATPVVGPRTATPIAEAAAVETAPEDDNPYTDDDTIVVGQADTFAGGVSGAGGTGGGPGSGYGGNGGAKAAPPPAPEPPEPDRSRPAHCRIDVDWGCEPNNTHEGALTIVRLMIRGNGVVEDVDVMTAPDGAFRKEAIACSRRQTCEAARDRHGRPVPGWTNPIRIRFTY